MLLRPLGSTDLMVSAFGLGAMQVGSPALWLLPLVIVLVALGALVVASQQSALVSFIYTLF